MRIKALSDFRFFNNDGYKEVLKDQEIDIRDELAKDFIRMNLVEEVKPLAEEVKIRNKKHKEGEENARRFTA